MRTTPIRLRFAAVALAAILSVALCIAPASGPSASYLPTASSAQPSTRNSLIAEAAPLSTDSTGSVYFRQTAHYLKDAFLNYWLMQGGLSIFGYPITEEFDQGGTTVQYFERARFEYHANSQSPWHVDLSPIGSLLTAGRSFAPATQTQSTPDRDFYPQTGHTLGGTFRQFWNASGGLATFGYPISEELQENGLTVQYFERARFELVGQGRVQLGRVGAELFARMRAGGLDGSVATPLDRPGFNMSFHGEATWFSANWDHVISLNKLWGNLPQDYVGRGLYAAAPADLNLYGRWARVTRGNRSIFVQFIDVINWPDIPYVRSNGIVIDLGEESYRALGQDSGGRYTVSFDVFWPGEGPDR